MGDEGDEGEGTREGRCEARSERAGAARKRVGEGRGARGAAGAAARALASGVAVREMSEDEDEDEEGRGAATERAEAARVRARRGMGFQARCSVVAREEKAEARRVVSKQVATRCLHRDAYRRSHQRSSYLRTDYAKDGPLARRAAVHGPRARRAFVVALLHQRPSCRQEPPTLALRMCPRLSSLSSTWARVAVAIAPLERRPAPFRGSSSMDAREGRFRRDRPLRNELAPALHRHQGFQLPERDGRHPLSGTCLFPARLRAPARHGLAIRAGSWRFDGLAQCV